MQGNARKSSATAAVFFDMEKAFDKVWRNGLVAKRRGDGVNNDKRQNISMEELMKTTAKWAEFEEEIENQTLNPSRRWWPRTIIWIHGGGPREKVRPCSWIAHVAQKFKGSYRRKYQFSKPALGTFQLTPYLIHVGGTRF